MPQELYCPDCGKEFDAPLKEKLKNGQKIFCPTCGNAFQIAIPAEPAKKQEGLAAGLKKFGKKLEKDIKKVGNTIEKKIQEKRGEQAPPPSQQAPPPTYTAQAQEIYPTNQGYTYQRSSHKNSSSHSQHKESKFMGGIRRVYQRMQPLTPDEIAERDLRNQARRNVLQAQFFRMHVLVYLLVNLMITVINLVVNSNYWFFLWVITGWGVILLAHTFVYVDSRSKKPAGFFMTNLFYFVIINAYLFFIDTFDGRTFSDPIEFAPNVLIVWGGFFLLLWVFNGYWSLESVKQEMRTSDKPDVLKKPVIIIHLMAYGIFNGLAFLSDLIFKMGVRWYLWTVIVWGIFILIQIFLSLIYNKLNLSMAGMLLFVHSLAYFSVAILLILIDAFDGQGFTDPVAWSLIPVGFWGVLYILHIIVYLVFLKRPTADEVEKEMQRLRSNK